MFSMEKKIKGDVYQSSDVSMQILQRRMQLCLFVNMQLPVSINLEGIKRKKGTSNSATVLMVILKSHQISATIHPKINILHFSCLDCWPTFGLSSPIILQVDKNTNEIQLSQLGKKETHENTCQDQRLVGSPKGMELPALISTLSLS